jgi:hypothetical protein
MVVTPLAPGVAGATKDRFTRTRPKGRWYGAVSLGYGPDGKTWRRHKVSGRTRAEVAEKLKQLQAEPSSQASCAASTPS